MTITATTSSISSNSRQTMNKHLASLMPRKKRSWLDYWARAWGEQSLLFKTIVLIAISLVMVVPAAIFTIWPLYVASILFAVGYMLSSKCLDNHYETLQENENLLMADKITDTYQTLLENLTQASSTLQSEVAETHKQNTMLVDETNNLAGINFVLDMGTRQLSHAASNLAEDSSELNKNAQNLKEITDKHERSIHDYEEKMQHLTQDFDNKTQNLQEEIERLGNLNLSTAIENARLKCTVTAFQSTVTRLMTLEKHQTANGSKFTQELDSIVDNAKMRFEEYFQHMTVLLSELHSGTDKTQQLNLQHELLLRQKDWNSQPAGKSIYQAECGNRYSTMAF